MESPCRTELDANADYLDRLMRRRSFQALWPLFAKAPKPAKEMTESFSALCHLRPLMLKGRPCRVIHVGDGAHARTAALFALKSEAENISVDPLLNEPLVEAWRARYEVRRDLLKHHCAVPITAVPTAAVPIAVVLALASCAEGFSAAPAASRSVVQAGPQDIGAYRAIVEAGEIPALSVLDERGFFAEHAIDLPAADCGASLCVHPMLAVAPRFDGGNWTLAFIGMNTSVDPSALPQNPRHLVLVLDASATLARRTFLEARAATTAQCRGGSRRVAGSPCSPRCRARRASERTPRPGAPPGARARRDGRPPWRERARPDRR